MVTRAGSPPPPPVFGSDTGSSSIGTFFSNSGGGGASDKPDTSIGKLNLDLTDPSTLGDIASSAAGFVGGVAGGALGLIGKVGVPGGPTLGDVPGAVGAGLGAVGSVKLPYLGPEGGQAATLGDVPGEVFNILGAPERAVERTVAGQRVEHAVSGQGVFNEQLPDWAQQMLDDGKTVDEVADALVAQNAGFTNNPLLNIGAGIIFDPMNLILPGAGKLGALAGKFGDAARTAEEASKLGLGERFVGEAYNGLMRGLPNGMSNAMDKLMGGTTSSIFRSLGTGPYRAIKGGLGKISPDAADRFDAALGKGSTQIAHAFGANELTNEVEHGYRAADAATVEDVQRAVTAMKSINPAHLDRGVENLLDKVAPNLSHLTGDAAREWAIPRLAEIAGISVEDAARALPKRLSEKDLQTIHLAFYGQAGGDLVAAKASLVGDEAARDIIPRLDDLTPISDAHLTQERAAALLDKIKRGTPDAFDEAAKYTALQKFMGGTPEAVVARLKDVLPKIKDALPRQVEEATTGKNPLPKALGDWRAKYQQLGYDLGFAPESGVKVIETPDGVEIFDGPFVHFIDSADHLNVRNPIGRVMDGLFRGVTQTKIITSSRNRMIRFGAKFGMTESEVRGFHQAVIGQAIERGENIRGLRPSDYERILENVVGHNRFEEIAPKVNPTYLVMRAFEGNLREVGWAQKATGIAKTATAEKGNIVAGIAEGIYPKFRFTLRPEFQAQEAIESPILNAMAGIRPTKVMDPDVQRLYGELLTLSPEYRTLDGAEYVTRLAGDAAVRRSFGANSLIGKALSRFDVKGIKEANRVAQIAAENPEAFESAVKDVNPDLWRILTTEYGTKDAAEITRRYVAERLSLTQGDAANAVKMVDAVKPTFSTADEETVWQAFRAAFEESAKNAFTRHYFNPERGFLERSLNHPYLGLYPLSYMWGKMVPQFARFLLARPFGLKAPLLGLEAAHRVQQEILVSRTTDPKGFDAFIKQNDPALYFAVLLLPSDPLGTNFPVNAPAYLRHAATGTLGGNGLYRKGDIAGRVKGEVSDIVANASPAKDIGDFLSAGASVLGNAPSLADQLDQTAKMLDGMFGGR